MKTKIIEHEYTETYPDGDVEHGALVAVKRWMGEYSIPREDGEPVEFQGYSFSSGWEIAGSSFSISSADQAREYIKLFRKIIEAEESGD